MSAQLEFDLSTPARAPTDPVPFGMPRRNGQLLFSERPDNFSAELAAIVADETRIHNERTPS